MTTTPLPPTPEYDIDTANHAGVRLVGFTPDTLRIYATQARADLEAENQRLREALIKAANALDVRCAFGDADVIRAELEKQS